jgi:hypothetical protein
VRIYDHRCAFWGLRWLTSDGRTVVDAAHIVPWSIIHDDDLLKGMALCRLCHWTFDQGLLGVSSKYLLLLSEESGHKNGRTDRAEYGRLFADPGAALDHRAGGASAVAAWRDAALAPAGRVPAGVGGKR